MSRSLLGGIVVALALVALVLLLVNPFEDQVRKADKKGAVFEFDYDSVDAVEIRTSNDTIMLSRTDSGWVVSSKDDFPADTTAVAAVLEALTGLQHGTVVSRNSEKRSRFEVDEHAGVEVVLSAQGNPVADLFVGKAGSDFTTSFVQVAGSAEVMQVRGVNRNMFDRGRGYRDRSLMRFNPQEVSEFTWAAADTGWTMTRQDTSWAISSPDGTKGNVIDKQALGPLRAAAGLTADGFAEGNSDSGLGSPAYQLTVKFMNGTSARVLVGSQDGSQFYASRPDRNAVYLLSEWNLSQFRKRAADFVE